MFSNDFGRTVRYRPMRRGHELLINFCQDFINVNYNKTIGSRLLNKLFSQLISKSIIANNTHW